MTGTTSFFVGTDITSDEQQAFPLAGGESGDPPREPVERRLVAVKGEEKLWRILGDKLEMLRVGARLDRGVASRARPRCELAQRLFPGTDPSLALSYERARANPRSVRRSRRRPRRPRSRRCGSWKASSRADQRCDLSVGAPAGLALRRGRRRKRRQSPTTKRRSRPEANSRTSSHTDLGTMLNNVALIYRRSGRQKAAEPYYLHALELYEKQLGPEHPDVAAVLNNLGVFYTNEGRFEEAEQTHQRALAIRRKANPNGHSDIAQSNCNLAVVYHSRGDLARAEELYRESLRGWENAAKAAGRLPDRRLELRRSPAIVRQSAQGGRDRSTRARKRRRTA